jgi:heavy metal sensor kinase
MSLLTLTFVILGGAAYGLLSYSLLKEVDNSLKGVARVMAERAERPTRDFFSSDINEIFRRFFGFSPWNPYFQMLDPKDHLKDPNRSSGSGRIGLSQEAFENAKKGLPTYETIKSTDQYPLRILTAPVMKRGVPIRLVRVGTSLKNVFQTRLRFLAVMGGLLPVGLLMAGFGGWFLAQRALRPVDNMTEAAQRISAERLDERVEETGAEDELDRLAKTLNQMLTRLDQAFKQVKRFSADASHELQTPITSLRGEIEVALRSPRKPEEYQEILKSSLEEVERLAGLVEGLLILARAESGMLKMDSQSMELAELIEEIYWKMKVLADKRSIDFVLSEVQSVIFHGDRERIRRLILNLVDNAIKYTPPNGRISLSLIKEERKIDFSVSDTGRGIDDDEREQIFQPFYRSEGVLSEKGSGLGLSIAKSIALAHGGDISVKSIPGIGSTFTLTLPSPS